METAMPSVLLCPICNCTAEKLCQGCQRISYCSIQHQKEDWKRHRASCSSFIIKTNSELNRYAVASRKLKAGSIILEEHPFVYAPRVDVDDNVSKQYGKSLTCLSCCKKLTGNCRNNICAKCRWPVCGSACSKAKQHLENECRHFSRNRVKFQPDAISSNFLYRGILILRSLLRLRRKNLKDEELWTRIMGLQSQKADKSVSTTDSTMDSKTVAMLQSYFKAKDIGDNDEWIRLNGIMDINAFSVNRVEQEHEEPSFATILFPKSSLLAHSCVPNATWSVAYSPEFSMRIRASRNIGKGEMITVSYNHSWNYLGNHTRKQLIAETAGFICNCDRCADSTELGSLMSALKCKSAQCRDYILPIPSPRKLNVTWKCKNSSCESLNQAENFINPEDHVKNIEREWNEIMTGMSAVPMIAPQLVENFINSYSDNILHPNHWLLQQASRSLVHFQGGQLKSLDRYQLQNFIKHCQYLLTISNLITPGISADRGLLLLYLSRALTLELKLMHKSGADCLKQFEKLKTIQDHQMEAFHYWKDDLQSKPLEEPMGYEASSLHDEIVHISALMATCK